MSSNKRPTKCCKPDCFNCPYAHCAYEDIETEYQSQYYFEHQKEISAKRKRYYAENRSKILARQKKNYDKEENSLKCRNWREKNLEKRRIYEHERYLRRKEAGIDAKRKATV